MVLAKRHVQRLWFPLPGAGGSIPSRAENAMSQEEFDALMPHEFWREVVDRVAAEVPGTLLLAEAFWLLEGYFVRTLGMHRVYNSAFMNMLRDEENAKYRSYLKKTIEFDPDILKRYVNFMSNPDERTAIDQFGDGDKYFGCRHPPRHAARPAHVRPRPDRRLHRALRHGVQDRPRWRSGPTTASSPATSARSRLCSRSATSSPKAPTSSSTTSGPARPSTKTSSPTPTASMASARSIVYNNRYDAPAAPSTSPSASWIRAAARCASAALSDGLALPNDPHIVFAYRDNASGLEYLRRSTDFHQHGMSFELRGYQYVVLLHWRELRSTAEQPWDRLCDALEGKGVHSVDDALLKLRLRPIHEAIRRAVSLGHLHCFSEVAEDDMTRALANVSAATNSPGTHASAKTGSASPVKAGAQSTNAPVTPSTQAEALLSDSISNPASPAARSSAGTTARPLDHRLQSFLEDSLACFDRVAELSSYELRESNPHFAFSHRNETEPPSDSPIDLRHAFHAACESAIASAIRLPRLEQTFSTAWPPAIRSVLPSNQPGVPQEKLWAPILGWIVVSSLPFAGRHAEVFDRLQLRSALAEAFSSMGIEGEQTWRAAARVRILLTLADQSEEWLDSSSFWHDPDVRWLAGLNESNDITYLHKEQFEELLCWIQLPALLKIAGSPKPDPRAIELLEAKLSTRCRIAREAAFNLDLYQRKFSNVRNYSVMPEVPVPPLNPVKRSKP